MVGWDHMWDENISFNVSMAKGEAEKRVIWEQGRQKIVTLYKSAVDKVLVRLGWNFFSGISTI